MLYLVNHVLLVEFKILYWISSCIFFFQSKRRSKFNKRGLSAVLNFLWEKAINSCKIESGIVSPRKRILRELEKVTLEEASKRQRAKATVRTVSSHSISSILAKDDDSVLRNLLRSPSPEVLRPCIPNASFPNHHIQVVYPSSAASFFPQVSQAFRSQIHPANLVWPYPPPSSPSQLPLYPIHSYSSNWPQSHRASIQDSSAGKVIFFKCSKLIIFVINDFKHVIYIYIFVINAMWSNIY